ncbi:MAG: hypothetical protein Q9165_007695 [Trypethelium subeluteriae]
MPDNIELGRPGPKAGPAEVDAIEAAPLQAMCDPPELIGKDRAVEFLKAVGGPVTVTTEDNRRILRKIDFVILPIILGIYFLQSLDKTALSYASVFGIIKDAHLVGDQYSWLGAIVYLAQLVMQPAVAYLLVKLPVGKFTAVMVLCWGAILCIMAATKNFGGLMATRFFLGAFEASVGHLILPDSPIDAKFLKTDHDRLIAIERLRMNQMGISSRAWKWVHVREAFLDPKTYLWFSMITAIAIPSGGISTFGPLIVESFGFDAFTTILFNIPFGAVQFVATLGSAYLATVWKVKSVLLVMLCLPPIAGCVMLLVVEHDKAHRGILLAGYYIISVYPAISLLIYSWSAQNTAGDTKRKVTTSVLFVGQSVGNVVGPHLYQPSEAPGYTRGLTANLALFIVLVALVCVGVFLVRMLNMKHARTRAEMGKAEKVLDLSMVGQKEVRDQGQVLNESEALVGDKAFDDITDLKNEGFIYIF